jgi:leucyl-tRNA synthetase
MGYDHKHIEQKWQHYWRQNQTFVTDNASDKPKYYVLDMFPYPSGAGLHVGHVEGYTATDIIARYKRQQGYEVLHPMGWDSFGLPAEQYAIRTGTHPAITTRQNIDTFRRQLQALGFSYDWTREFATSDPKYYKWTQWIFTLLYQRGLAYEAEVHVNYCPALGTVLANEEVENGVSIEGGHPVERRPLKQWILKITAYAERLLSDLDELDWPPHLKRLQINWIGKSVGAQVDFSLAGHEERLQVFTTRPDTLFGVTYMVLAPEHPLVKVLTTGAQRETIATYQLQTAHKSDLERTDLNQNKTGVFTGGYAIHPITGAKLPVWISDYVMMSYGTGAIMAVPAHDERDFAFAKQYQLPVQCVYTPASEELEAAYSTPEERIAQAQSIATGNACWSGGGCCANSCHGDLDLNGLNIEDAKAAAIAWLEKHQRGKSTTTYKLRDWLFARQRYWGEPFPILHLADGTKRVMDLDELPLCPPDMTDFAPTGDGRGPLARVTEWVEITDPLTGQKARRDINTMPQWAGSCWYYLRFCDPQNAQEAWSQTAVKKWLPVDLYVGGVEHAVLHLLYSRFWHKVLYDCGLVPTKEPFQSLRNPGMITSRSYQRSSGAYVDPAETEERQGLYYHRESGELLRSQVEKMSKSKLNGVTPDEIVEEYGADALRLYEMFMGPLEKEKIWSTDAVSGCYRFLKRFYDLVTSSKVSDDDYPSAKQLTHRTVHNVARAIESLQFNTAIAKMMEFINEFGKLPAYPKSALSMVTQALMPFAPHMAEEAWQLLGNTGSVSLAPFPVIDQKLLMDHTATYVVQVNGKLRARFEMPLDTPQEEVMRVAKEQHAVQRALAEKTLQKVIFVPNKLLNLVVE